MEVSPELEKAAWTIRGDKRSTAFHYFLLLDAPEMGGDSRVLQGKDAAEPAAGRGLFSWGQVITKGLEEPKGFIGQLQFVVIMAGTMVI